jgi:uncharacterized protein
MLTVEEVGRVRAVYRYPVKSMGGELVPKAKIGWHGIADDRRFAFQVLSNDTGLPWASAREYPKLVTYRAMLEGAAGAGGAPIIVITPDGHRLPLNSPELLGDLEAISGERLRLTHLRRGTYDAMNVSLITEQSIGAISRPVGSPLEAERFRPNILIRAHTEEPYAEDKWIGMLVAFGDGSDSARLRINREDVRCRVPGLDPHTGEENKAVLASIVSARRSLLGVYASVERPGMVSVDDPVLILKA